MKDNKLVEETRGNAASVSIQFQQKQKRRNLDVFISKLVNISAFLSAPGANQFINFCNKAVISFNDKENNTITVDDEILIDNYESIVPASKPSIGLISVANNTIRLQFNALNTQTKIPLLVLNNNKIACNEAELLQFH